MTAARISGRVVFAWCLLALLPVPSAAIAAAVGEHTAFDRLFASVLADNGIPGGAYAIVQGGQVVATAGHGVRSLQDPLPVDADTVFRIASVSKTFAAQLTALLVKDGTLAWNDSVAKRVPSMRIGRNGLVGTLRLEDLLGQSTGIVPNAYDNLLDAGTPLERILPRFAELEPVCPPGRCYTYQNILFGLIDPAIAQASGLEYADLVQERLFVPLAMDSASLGLDGYLAAANRAAPHVRRQGRWQSVPVQRAYYQVAPAAGINASARDLAQWLIGQMGHRPQAIPPDTVEQLTQPRVRTPRELGRRGWRDWLDDAHYGLGWRIYRIGGETLYLHSGWVQGFVADIAYSRSRQVGLVVLLNGETGAFNDITTGFWKPLLAQAPLEVSTP